MWEVISNKSKKEKFKNNGGNILRDDMMMWGSPAEWILENCDGFEMMRNSGVTSVSITRDWAIIGTTWIKMGGKVV